MIHGEGWRIKFQSLNLSKGFCRGQFHFGVQSRAGYQATSFDHRAAFGNPLKESYLD